MAFYNQEMERQVEQPVVKPRATKEEKDNILREFRLKKEDLEMNTRRCFGVLMGELFQVLHETKSSHFLIHNLLEVSLLSFVSF